MPIPPTRLNRNHRRKISIRIESDDLAITPPPFLPDKTAACCSASHSNAFFSGSATQLSCTRRIS